MCRFLAASFAEETFGLLSGKNTNFNIFGKFLLLDFFSEPIFLLQPSICHRPMLLRCCCSHAAINIMRASEMVGPVVRRFPNVSDLGILCILSRCSDDDDDDDDDDLMLNADAIRRAVPFMMQFPKLEMVFWGGAY